MDRLPLPAPAREGPAQTCARRSHGTRETHVSPDVVSQTVTTFVFAATAFTDDSFLCFSKLLH